MFYSTSTLTALIIFLSVSSFAASPHLVSLNQDQAKSRYEESQKTEVWTPVPAKIEAVQGKAPSDAVVLFNGSGLESWVNQNGKPAQWESSPYAITIKPGEGDISTKQSFCDVQLHIEWRSAREDEKSGQNKANSGIFLQNHYEVQMLDSYTNTTYVNGQAGAVYKQFIPLVNASRPAQEWQSYDIIFTAPRFEDNKLVSPAFLTVLHNGVLVQNHVELAGQTQWIGDAKYHPHGCLPIKLQDHGSANSFRNIWVREL